MDREIKFRAWDKENKKMWYGGFWLQSEGSIWMDTEDGPEELPQDEFELMQFTGLKDKNGKRGYAGTIVKGQHKTDAKETFVGPIVWDDFGCRWVVARSDGWNMEFNVLQTCFNFEFIGNATDNPELLEEPK